MKGYVWSVDDYEYSSEIFTSEDEALIDASNSCEDESVWIGEIVPARNYLKAAEIGQSALEDIIEALGDNIEDDMIDRSIEWTSKQAELLGKLIIDYMDRKIGFNCFGVRNQKLIRIKL